MCVEMYIRTHPRYMGQTNNNNKRYQLCIRVCFTKFTSIGFYIRFPVYCHYYIIVVYILLYHLYSILPLSYPYLIIPWVSLLDITCYLFLAPHACAHDTVFNAYLWFRFIDTRVLIYAHHLAFITPLVRKFMTSLDLHVQILEFGACGFSRFTDQRGAAEAWIIGRPSEAPSF